MIEIPDSIFSVNEDGVAVCPKCQKPIKECSCVSYDPSQPKYDQFSLTVRLDRRNRKGKKVMIIEGLPRDEVYCRKLAKILKTKSGCGGTCYVDESGGIIEIQGQKGELIKQLLSNEGFVHIH